MGISFHIIPKPVLVATLLEGGDLLPNTTYYFVAIHIYNALGETATAYTCSAQSPNSEQISITTSATHKSISLDWSYSTYPGSGLILKWDYESLLNTDGSYKNDGAHTKWNKSFSSTGWSGLSKTIGASDLLTSARLMYMLGNFNLSTDTTPDDKIDYKSFGIPFIITDDYETAISIINAIKNSVIKDCFVILGTKTIFAYCHIYATGGRLLLKDMVLYFHSSMIHTRINSALSISDSSYSIANRCQIGLYGTYKNTTIVSLGVYRHQSTSFNPSFDNTFTYFLQFGSYTDISGMTMVSGGMNFTYLDSVEGSNDCTFYDLVVNLYRSRYALMKRCRFVSSHVYDLDINNHTDLDLVHDFKDCTTSRPEGLILVRQNGTTNTDTSKANFIFSVAVAVNVEGSTVEFIDNQGRVYTNTEEVLSYFNIGNPSVATLKSVTTNLNPFTCRVTKEGYQSYEVTIEILKPIELAVQLKEVVPPIYIDQKIQATVEEVTHIEGTVNEIEIIKGEVTLC